MQRQKLRTSLPWRQVVRLLFTKMALERNLIGQEPEKTFRFLSQFLGRAARVQWFLSLMMMLLTVFLTYLLLYSISSFEGIMMSSVGGLICLYTCFALRAHERARVSERVIREVQAGQLVARAEWPQALPALLTLMEQTGWPRDDNLRLWWWGETYPILVRWLPRMLPGELGPNECRTLRKLLKINMAYEDLHVAILLTLGTARDQKARRIATQLFRHSPYERVREAARDCLLELGEPVSRRLERRD